MTGNKYTRAVARKDHGTKGNEPTTYCEETPIHLLRAGAFSCLSSQIELQWHASYMNAAVTFSKGNFQCIGNVD